MADGPNNTRLRNEVSREAGEADRAERGSFFTRAGRRLGVTPPAPARERDPRAMDPDLTARGVPPAPAAPPARSRPPPRSSRRAAPPREEMSSDDLNQMVMDRLAGRNAQPRTMPMRDARDNVERAMARDVLPTMGKVEREDLPVRMAKGGHVRGCGAAMKGKTRGRYI